MHGFDEFFGNLYHLNAEEEPESEDYPAFKKQFGPRGVLHCKADGKGGETIENTGPLTKKRMETIDEEVTERAITFIDECHGAGKPFFLWYDTTAMHLRTHSAANHKCGRRVLEARAEAGDGRQGGADPRRFRGLRRTRTLALSVHRTLQLTGPLVRHRHIVCGTKGQLPADTPAV